MNDFFERKGIVRIDKELFDKNPEDIFKIFKDVLIIKATNDFIRNEITYCAYSKHFEILDVREAIPEYLPIVTKENGEIKTVKWERK